MDRCSFWCFWKDAQSLHNDVMAEERLVGNAALSYGAVGCRLDGVVVVVVGEERRFARPMLTVSVRADSSGGKTAELLKDSASGRGVSRRRGECWTVPAPGGGREAYSAGNANVRRWGMSADLPSGAAAGCSRGGAWSSEDAVNC